MTINRRKFLKLLASASALVALAPRAAAADAAGSGRRVRVTVLCRKCFTDLQSRFLDDPEAGPCTAFVPGSVYTLTTGAPCPDGFCRKAWGAIQASVADAPASGTVVVACPDGTRPVIFRVELL